MFTFSNSVVLIRTSFFSLSKFTQRQFTTFRSLALDSKGLPIASNRFKASIERAKEHLPTKKPIPNVKKIVMVTSAKGGVGKSTIAVNLALSLALQQKRVGLLDTDLHGPSIPWLLNIEGIQPELTSENLLKPVSNYGLQCMSMGLLVPSASSIAWRGLMVHKALNQLLFQVAWDPPLDYLIMDLPPGTSDVHISIAQQVPIDGALVVSTPHSLSVADVIKGIDLLQLLNVPILGLIANFSYFMCPTCTTRHSLFGSLEALTKVSKKGSIPILTELLWDTSLLSSPPSPPPSSFSSSSSSSSPIVPPPPPTPFMIASSNASSTLLGKAFTKLAYEVIDKTKAQGTDDKDTVLKLNRSKIK